MTPIPDPMKEFPEPTEAEGIKVYSGISVDHWKDAWGEWVTADAAISKRLLNEINKRKKIKKEAEPYVKNFDPTFLAELELLRAIYDG